MGIYKVTTEGDVEGRTTETIGYASGHPSDIKAFYDSKKCYSINLEEINIVEITSTSLNELNKVLAKKETLVNELTNIDEHLKKLNYGKS